MDNLLFAIRRSLFLYFLRRTFSPGVNRTVPLSMLCAHSHSALIRSASAYSSMAFLSFVFFVLFSICRQRTCLFTRPDIVRLTVAPTRHPFYMRLKVDRESAHRSSLPNRKWRGRLQQCVRRLTQSAHDDEFEAPPPLQFTFQQMPTLSTYQSMVFE